MREIIRYTERLPDRRRDEDDEEEENKYVKHEELSKHTHTSQVVNRNNICFVVEHNISIIGGCCDI